MRCLPPEMESSCSTGLESAGAETEQVTFLFPLGRGKRTPRLSFWKGVMERQERLVSTCCVRAAGRFQHRPRPQELYLVAGGRERWDLLLNSGWLVMWIAAWTFRKDLGGR